MLHTIRIFLADPFVPGAPTAPEGDVSGKIGGVWGTVGWIVTVIACFALVGCVIAGFKNEQRGGNNEALTWAGRIIAGVLAMGLIVGFVGTISGT